MSHELDWACLFDYSLSVNNKVRPACLCGICCFFNLLFKYINYPLFIHPMLEDVVWKICYNVKGAHLDGHI